MFASSLSAWIGTLSGRANRKARRGRPAVRRPLAVEPLEARTVPAVYNWIPTAPGTYSWSDPSNWSSSTGSIPKQAGDVANVTSAAAGNQVINLSEPIAVGTLNLGSTGAGVGGFTITGNGNTLSFQDPSGAPALTDLAGDGDAILAPVNFVGALTITNGSPTQVSLFGPVTATGSGVLSVTGTGVVAFPQGDTLAANVSLAGNGTITNPAPLFAASFFDSGLYAFDAATGAVLATLIAPSYNPGPLLSGPAGLTVGPDNNLYISSQSNDAILKYDLSAFTLSTFISAADLTAARNGTANPNPVFAPAGLRFGPDGNLYVTLNGGQSSTGNGSVIRFTVTNSSGQLSYVPTSPPTPSYVAVATGLLQPNGLTFGRPGDATSLYVSYGGYSGQGGVVKVTDATSATPVQSSFVALGSGGLSTAAGLTWGPDGNLYVADLAALEAFGLGQGQILEYSPGGGFIKKFNQASLSMQFPSDVLFDAQGRLLTGNLGPARPPATQGSIDRFNSNGSLDRLLVNYTQFPNTGTLTGVGTTSGITPAQLALLPSTGLTINGTLNPGGSGVPGTLTTGSVAFGSGSTFSVALTGTSAGTGYGNLVSTGTVALNNAVLAAGVGFAAPLGSQFVIVSAPAITGTFAGLTDGTLFTSNSQLFRINYVAATPTGNAQVVLTRVEAPTFTSANNFLFYTRLAGSFQATTSGFPASVFSETGTLPAGITFSSAGVLSGSAAPGSEGVYNVTLIAANGILPNATQPFTITVVTGQNPLFTSVNNATFTSGTGGAFTVTATGAPTPVLALTTTPPAGVAFNPANGQLSVSTTTPDGVYNLTFTATNGLSQASQAFTLTVGSAPAITSANSATFYTGRNNAFTVTTTGFPTPNVSVTGTLPTGVTLTGALLSGTPTQTGSFPITLTATNALGSAPQSFTLTVLAGVAPAITSPSSAQYTAGVGTGATPFTVTATGTPVPTLAQTLVFPAGVTFDTATGQLTVATTTLPGTYNLRFTADNGVSPAAVQNFTLTVGSAPAFTSGTTTTFTFGTAGSFQMTATGFPAPAFTTASTLPTGVTLSAAGLLTSTAATPTGSYPIAVTATNSFGTANQNFTLIVASPPAFTSGTATTFTLNAAGNFQATATGFPAPTFSTASTLPAGVTFSPTGLLSGTPTQGGSFPLTLTATNSAGQANQSFTLTVNQPPAITSGTAATFFTGRGNTFQVTATGFPAPTFTTASTLPAGVTLSAAGVLSGTPTEGGTFPITIKASNGVNPDATQNFTLTVDAGGAPAITSAASTTVSNATGGTFAVTATGTPTPVLAETAALPAGVTFDPATGILTVAAGTVGGVYPLVFTATNGVSPAASQNFTLTVNQPVAITSGNSTTFTVGVAGSFPVTATGFPVPTLALTGTLPTGVAFSPDPGVLFGTPAAGTGGVYQLTITATNPQGSVSQPFTLTVNQLPTFTSAIAATFDTRLGGAFTVTATGFPVPALALTSGSLPAGVTFDPATGILTVPALTNPGVYPLTFTATSSAGQATQAFTLTVAAPPIGPVSRLAVGGSTNGAAYLYDQAITGLYNLTPTAVVSPFGNIGVNVRTAVADVNGDGVNDTILVTGPGVPTRFAVVSGVDNTTLLVAPTAPFAGSESFTGGGYVAAGDFDRDGRADIVVTPDQSGGPRVVVFTLSPLGLVTRTSFLGIEDPNFRGGARPAVGDVNGDGVPDLVVMAGFGGGPRVAVFNGATVFGASPAHLVNDFFAFEPNLRNGAYAAVGDLNGDGAGDLIFGAGPGGGPRVLTLDGKTVFEQGGEVAKLTPLSNFFVNGNDTARGGVRVATKLVTGTDDIALVTGSGEGDPSQVKVYPNAANGGAGEPVSAQTIDPFAQVLAGGVFVG